jgi:hypothetical protein
VVADSNDTLRPGAYPGRATADLTALWQPVPHLIARTEAPCEGPDGRNPSGLEAARRRLYHGLTVSSMGEEPVQTTLSTDNPLAP